MQATATQERKANTGASDFFQEDEYCQCLNASCESTIPRSHVVKRIDERTGRQEVKATCPHCRAEYHAVRVLGNGRWKTILFDMKPAEGFEPIGGTAIPTFDPPAQAPLVDHINQRFEESAEEIDGDESGVIPNVPPTAPEVEQLDTDCDAAKARAESERTQPARELTFDPSTSQIDFKEKD